MNWKVARARRVRALLTSLASVPLFAIAAGAVDWQELGPAPTTSPDYTGRVSAVACSRTDPNRYFVAGADGGVWRTTDGGATWVPLTDSMPTSAIGALAIDPTNEDTVYAGTGEANFANHSRYGLGLYKSTDAGETWEQLAESMFAGRCFARIVMDSLNPQTVYAAITRAGGFPEMAAAKGHPGATGPVGVFRSDDGGATWAHLSNGLPSLGATDLAMDPADANVLYAAIGHVFGSPDNGIYKTTDGGASWVRLDGGLPTTPLGRISLTVAPSMPQRIYTLITNPCDAAGGGASTLGAFRSDDGGDSWTAIPVGSLQATYGWYLSFVSVHPDDANLVVMGGLNLRRSMDAGASWNTITPPHVDMHGVDWDAAGRLVIGDDGGVHRSSNLGGSWAALNAGLGVIQFYAGISTHPTDDLVIYGGTQDNGSNRRNTDGTTWTQVFGGDGGCTAVNYWAPHYVHVEYQGTGNLYRSTDGGDSFASSAYGIVRTDRNCFLPPFVLAPNNPSVILYGTHRVYRSINAGNQWSPISGDLTDGAGAIRALAIAPSDPDVVYAATNDGNVLVSFDGGATFEPILDDVPGWPRITREICIDPFDPLTMYLAVAFFDQTQIRRTRDAGQTWDPLDASFPDIPVNVLAVDSRGRLPTIYGGADDGVYRSVDDGRTWHRYGRGLPHAAVIDMRLQPERGRLLIATQGRGAWSIPVALAGDLNGDGLFNAGDISALVLALVNRPMFAQQYPDVDPNLNGDLDGDGLLTNGDIPALVELLTL